jgi:hypothetical protein
MSTHVADRPPMSRNPLANVARNWMWFWFSPADPTLLGLIRLFTGLLTFYVCLAYTVDLQELFGPDAWVDLEALHEYRAEMPYPARPFDWSELDRTGPLPAQTLEEQLYIQRYGMNPRDLHTQGYHAFSIWYHVTDPRWMMVVHVAILVIVFLFMIGFCTRITSVLTWLGVLSYTQRAPTTLFGMDTMMNLLLIYLMIGPSGAAFSVDSMIARYWGTWRALRARRPAPISFRPAPSISANVALRCMQFNLCLIYFAAGVSKLRGDAWWSGTAIWGTIANPEFSPIHYSWFLGFLRFLASHRWLWELSMTIGATFTFSVELGFPFLIWLRPWRWVMLCMALGLHTGIALFMGLNTFSLMMVGLLMSFLPPEAVQWLVQLPSRGARHLRLAFNNRARGQVRAASLVRALDAWDQVRLLDPPAARRGRAGGESVLSGEPTAHVEFVSREGAPQSDRLHLITPEGETRTGFFLWEELVRSLRLLQPLIPLMWIPGVRRLGMLWFPPDGEGRATGNGQASRPRSENEKVTR